MAWAVARIWGLHPWIPDTLAYLHETLRAHHHVTSDETTLRSAARPWSSHPNFYHPLDAGFQTTPKRQASGFEQPAKPTLQSIGHRCCGVLRFESTHSATATSAARYVVTATSNAEAAWTAKWALTADEHTDRPAHFRRPHDSIPAGQECDPELDKRLCPHLKITTGSSGGDETHVKVKALSMYSYSCADAQGHTNDFLLSASRFARSVAADFCNVSVR